METKLPFHLLLLFTIWDPEKGVMGSFVIGLARGRTFRIFYVTRSCVSAFAAHGNTIQKKVQQKGLPWLNWKEILFKNILAPMQDLNKISNNNKFEENASRT